MSTVPLNPMAEAGGLPSDDVGAGLQQTRGSPARGKTVAAIGPAWSSPSRSRGSVNKPFDPLDQPIYLPRDNVRGSRSPSTDTPVKTGRNSGYKAAGPEGEEQATSWI